MNHSQIIGIGTANPSLKLTQEETFHLAGYKDERILSIFLNSGIDHRYFYIEGEPNRNETSDQLNARFLRGAVKTGCEAIVESLKSAETTVKDIDFLVVCTCTGYVCPDVGSRLIAHMGFRSGESRQKSFDAGGGDMLGLLLRGSHSGNGGRQCHLRRRRRCFRPDGE